MSCFDVGIYRNEHGKIILITELHCLFSLKQLLNSTHVSFFYHKYTGALHKQEGLAA